MPRNSQLSRWGAISKIVPDVAPYSKVFFVGDSDHDGFVDFVNEFPPDEDGVVRVYSSVNDTTLLANVRSDRGDVILVMPGHSETISSQWNLATSGVKVIGLGSGDNRPLLNIGADTGVYVSADGVRLSNLVFRANDRRAVGIQVGAQGVEIDHCRFDDTAVGNYFVHAIESDSADRIDLHDNEFAMTGADTGTTGAAIVINDSPFPKVQRNWIHGDYPLAAVEFDTDVSDGALVADNKINNVDTDGVTIRFRGSANTGLVVRNMMATGDTVEHENAVVEGATKWVENYLVNDTAETGAVVPTTASST